MTRMLILAFFITFSAAFAAEFEMTPAIQAELDAQQKTIAEWAADPAVVAAVKAQNAKGPLADMDNAKWKATKRSDPLVKAFQENDIAKFLKSKLDASNGKYVEAFVSAEKGEKVAFVEKTTSYLHKGNPKFDTPMSGKPWQGKAEFDESTQVYCIQISTAVLENSKPIGVLVVGIGLAQLQKK
jgi:hypothetical protein